MGTEAGELALALELGLATVDEAISWADAAIAQLDAPPYALIEVATARASPISEVAHLLRGVPGARDEHGIITGVLGRLAVAVRDGHTSPRMAASLLYEMHLRDLTPSAEAAGEMARLDDAFCLAVQGSYGTIEKAIADLRAFLKPYLKQT